MKKLFLLAAFITLGFAVSAQVITLTVVNHIPCQLYFVLYGDLSGSCGQTHRSMGAGLPGTSTITFTDPTDPNIPGGMDDGWGNMLGRTDVFTRIAVYHGDPNIACIPSGNVYVGGCPGTPASASLFIYDYNSTCYQCTTIMNSVTWTSTGPTSARVDIY